MNSLLITGGTGTFGHAAVRYLLEHTDTGRICIYSRNEHSQAKMREAFNDDERLRWMIGDVRDVERLERAMIGVSGVIHAAALKRIEVGEYNPDEMVKTNIIGTSNVVAAAVKAGVKRCVLTSSDKAYAPVSPYGCSKMMGESIFLSANITYALQGTRFAAARYGNIWGAQGSVVPRWKELVKNGATSLPVTDPECTRFYMTTDEAVKLVYDLLCHMKGGELVIPDWLPAYRLGDLVEAFGCIPVIKGLPHWEKRHENMDDSLCSRDARRLTISELKEIIGATA